MNSYPFLTKAQIKKSIAESDEFVVECLLVMHSRNGKTNDRNKMGWMSSHTVHGTALALKASSGELTEDELNKSRSMVSRYTKQLAQHFRREKLAAEPELAETAAAFGVAK